MAKKDILGMYGGDSRQPKASSAKGGGEMPVRDVNRYRPPAGPIGIGNRGPGLGGNNYGNCGTQARQPEPHDEAAEARRYTGNRPMRNEETDAAEFREHYGSAPRQSGGPGLGGKNHGAGSNRRG